MCECVRTCMCVFLTKNNYVKVNYNNFIHKNIVKLRQIVKLY